MSSKYGGHGGAIVNLSSVAARLGAPGEYVDYAASKGAIDTLTIGLAREVAAEGVRVNAVRPGIIYTDIHASGGMADRVDRMKDLIPMRRGGQADEVARILWLLRRSQARDRPIVDVTGGADRARLDHRLPPPARLLLFNRLDPEFHCRYDSHRVGRGFGIAINKVDRRRLVAHCVGIAWFSSLLRQWRFLTPAVSPATSCWSRGRVIDTRARPTRERIAD
jgi:hypothetical protein